MNQMNYLKACFRTTSTKLASTLLLRSLRPYLIMRKTSSVLSKIEITSLLARLRTEYQRELEDWSAKSLAVFMMDRFKSIKSTDMAAFSTVSVKNTTIKGSKAILATLKIMLDRVQERSTTKMDQKRPAIGTKANIKRLMNMTRRKKIVKSSRWKGWRKNSLFLLLKTRLRLTFRASFRMPFNKGLSCRNKRYSIWTRWADFIFRWSAVTNSTIWESKDSGATSFSD